jgi:hypothetical protein
MTIREAIDAIVTHGRPAARHSERRDGSFPISAAPRGNLGGGGVVGLTCPPKTVPA